MARLQRERVAGLAAEQLAEGRPRGIEVVVVELPRSRRGAGARARWPAARRHVGGAGRALATRGAARLQTSRYACSTCAMTKRGACARPAPAAPRRRHASPGMRRARARTRRARPARRRGRRSRDDRRASWRRRHRCDGRRRDVEVHPEEVAGIESPLQLLETLVVAPAVSLDATRSLVLGQEVHVAAAGRERARSCSKTARAQSRIGRVVVRARQRPCTFMT